LSSALIFQYAIFENREKE